MKTCDSCIEKLILQVFRVAEAESDAIEVLSVLSFLISEKSEKWRFFEKTAIIALRRLYYRFFCASEADYELINSLSVFLISKKIKKK